MMDITPDMLREAHEKVGLPLCDDAFFHLDNAEESVESACPIGQLVFARAIGNFGKLPDGNDIGGVAVFLGTSRAWVHGFCDGYDQAKSAKHLYHQHIEQRAQYLAGRETGGQTREVMPPTIKRENN